MEKQQDKLTLEHLSALYWLKVLDEFDGCEELETLGEKYQNFESEPETDEEEEKREKLDEAVRELIEMGYVEGTIENDVITELEFTDKGKEIAKKIKNERSLKEIEEELNKEIEKRRDAGEEKPSVRESFKILKRVLFNNWDKIFQVLIIIFQKIIK